MRKDDRNQKMIKRNLTAEMRRLGISCDLKTCCGNQLIESFIIRSYAKLAGDCQFQVKRNTGITEAGPLRL